MKRIDLITKQQGRHATYRVCYRADRDLPPSRRQMALMTVSSTTSVLSLLEKREGDWRRGEQRSGGRNGISGDIRAEYISIRTVRLRILISNIVGSVYFIILGLKR